MKKLFIAGILLLGISITGKSQTNKAEKAILDNFKKQEECWNKGDTDCYCEAYIPSDSTQTISTGGVVYGVENIKAFYKKYWPPQRMGKLNFDQLNLTKLTNKHYFVTGRFNIVFPNDQKASGYFSVIMKKVKGEWLIFSDHSS